MGATLSHLCKNVRGSTVGEIKTDTLLLTAEGDTEISFAPADGGDGAHRQRSQLMRIREV